MNKMFRTLVVLFCCALSSALFAGSKTYDINCQGGALTLYIEMYYAGDYYFELINNTTSETVAVLSTVASFNNYVEDYSYGDYYQGTSGEGDLYNSWGVWSVNDLPSGDYSVHVFDYSHPNWSYDLSNVFD